MKYLTKLKEVTISFLIFVFVLLQVQNKSHIDWPSSIGDKLLHRMNKMDASMNDLKVGVGIGIELHSF